MDYEKEITKIENVIFSLKLLLREVKETSKETKEKAREYGNNLIKRKCIYCKQPISGENISYCDKCLMNNDYSN